MRRAGLPTVAVSCVWLAGAIACTQTPQETTDTAIDTTTEAVSDTWITTSVQAQLYDADELRGRDVEVSTEDGVVMLSGTVESDAARQQAVSVARGTDGVVRVDDRLRVDAAAGEAEVASEARSDDLAPAWITTKIQAQYFVDPEIKPWNIDVTTWRGGIVELRGDVDAAEDKARAVKIAQATEGVTRVDDHLRVVGDEPREAAAREPETGTFDTPDAWTTAKIQSKYFLDGDVKGLSIDVTTREGVVTLSGTAESAAEQRQAVAIARNTDGVRDVRDQLQVRAESASASGSRSTADEAGGAVADTWITTKIQSKYFLDADVRGHEIDVDTQEGVVTLTGSVQSNAIKEEAEQIARETDGVARVQNRLTVTAAATN